MENDYLRGTFYSEIWFIRIIYLFFILSLLTFARKVIFIYLNKVYIMDFFD